MSVKSPGSAGSGGGGTPGGTSGQVQYNNAGAFGGITTTGSGNAVLATSPTLVTPALGTPSALVLTNATGLAPATGVGSGNLFSGVLSSAGNTLLDTAGTATVTGKTMTSTLNTFTFDAMPFQIGAAPSATPAAQSVAFQNGVGTNIAAANATIIAPLGTGTGTNGNIIFNTGVATTSGSGAPTQTTALTLQAENGPILIGHGGASTKQLTFTPNSGTSASFGMENSGSLLVLFEGNTKTMAFGNGYFLNSNGYIQFTNSTSDPTTTSDTGISRLSAGVLSIDNGSAGSALGSIKAFNITSGGATADKSYSIQVPTTGFSITIANNVSTLILNPAGTLATGTITMPAAPIDGQLIRVSSTQIQTALTVSANTGQSINNAPTALATAGVGFGYIYQLSSTTWFRLY